MVRLNKVYGNLMVDVRATNAKLRTRAVRLTMHAAYCDEARAVAALEASSFRVKTAIVMVACELDSERADALLASVDGNVRKAMERSR